MRKISGVLLALTMAVVGVFGLAAPASADSGDGNEACNSGEICFWDEYWEFPIPGYLTKQFWWGANHYANGAHSAYYFWSTYCHCLSNYLVMDYATFMKNRDTECTVYVFDVDGVGVWSWYISVAKNTSGYVDIRKNVGGSYVTVNNGHSRCNTNSPANL